MPKLVRRSRDFWTSLVEDYERGDHRGSHREFAARHGVGCGSFERWLYHLRNESRGRGWRSRRPAGKRKGGRGGWPLVEVQGVSVEDARLEVELANGRRVLVPAGFDAEALRRLLAVIAEPVT